MNCSDVDNLIIDFSQLISQVLFGSFYILLPPNFTMKTPQQPAERKTVATLEEMMTETQKEENKGDTRTNQK